MTYYLGMNELMTYEHPLVITEIQFNENILNDTIPSKVFTESSLTYYANLSDISTIESSTEFAILNNDQKTYYYFLK